MNDIPRARTHHHTHHPSHSHPKPRLTHTTHLIRCLPQLYSAASDPYFPGLPPFPDVHSPVSTTRPTTHPTTPFSPHTHTRLHDSLRDPATRNTAADPRPAIHFPSRALIHTRRVGGRRRRRGEGRQERRRKRRRNEEGGRMGYGGRKEKERRRRRRRRRGGGIYRCCRVLLQ